LPAPLPKDFIQHLQELSLGLSPRAPLQNSARLEQKKRGYSSDLVPIGRHRIPIHVQFPDLQPALVLNRQLIHYRLHHLAWWAPGGPKVNQNRHIRLDYFPLETPIRQTQCMAHR
jgi:hypothetical protein